MVFTIGKQEIFIKGNGRKGNNVEEGFIVIVKDISIKVTGLMDQNMVMGCKSGKLENQINIKVNFKGDKDMAKVFISIKTEIFMMEIGKKE